MTLRPVQGALALAAADPRRAAALALVSLGLGLALEGLLHLAFGPVQLGGGRPTAPAFWALGILYGAAGSGLVAWFTRWLAAQLVAGWLTGRWYTPQALTYIADVQNYQNQKIWRSDGFVSYQE